MKGVAKRDLIVTLTNYFTKYMKCLSDLKIRLPEEATLSSHGVFLVDIKEESN